MAIFTHKILYQNIVKNSQFLWLPKLLYECHTMITTIQKSIKMTHRMCFHTWVTFLTWSGWSIGQLVNLVKITKIVILAKISIFRRKFGFSRNCRGWLRMWYMVENESLGCPRVLLKQYLISRYILDDFWEIWKNRLFLGFLAIFSHTTTIGRSKFRYPAGNRPNGFGTMERTPWSLFKPSG